MVDSDRITGKAKETVGKVEAAAGDAVGDHETELRGRVRQAAGAAQDAYGQAKDQAKDAVGKATDALGQAKDKFSDNFSDVGDSAERALHSLEREVKARPLIALLIAALVGFVLAQLTTR